MSNSMDLLKNYSDESESDDAEQSVMNECLTDSGLNNSISKTESQSTVNFFGLNDEPEEENYEIPSKRSKQYKMVSNDSEMQVEVPDSEFWRNFIPPENVQDSSKQVERDAEVKVHHSQKYRGKRQRTQECQQYPHYQEYYQKRERNDNNGRSTPAFHHDGRKSTGEPYCSAQNNSMSCESQTQRQLFYVHSKISPHLTKCNTHNKCPQRIERELEDNKQTVNRVMWNYPPYCHLFLSASMDGSIRIWNIWTQLAPCVKHLSVHKRAVKDAVWSRDGRHILSCSFDKTAKWIDVEKGIVVSSFGQSSFITSCKLHPNDPHLSITGGHNVINCWDSRSPSSPCRVYTYKNSIGQIQDVLFNRDGDVFFSTGNEISRDSSDRNIMAWDFRSTSVLSNQIYQERYSCTRLKLHPTSGHFLAQSHGNYIAIFSVNKPFKMNKAKRLEGHKLSGYSVGFDISPDGSLVLSGDSSGQVFCYDFQTGRIINKIQTGLDIAMDVSFNPVLPSAAVICGWNGKIQVLN
uniref:WD repeat-containing protein 25-like n=1 Tax=Crassostrea virginica TaxID=6565 RepID=A0A8B8DZA8_CRAVI|nr:WD repeat-containing protein 25-like [Crassostrea virginica]XP_022332326.1 WD repeat-containing protein 25-like [Crassostrea virginica]